MGRPRSTDEFRDFYADSANASEYDVRRQRTLKQRIVRRREAELFIEAIRARRSILEIGCGTGELTSKLPRDANVLAIDTSAEMLERARKKDLPAGARLEQRDLFELGALGETFDAIIASRVFLHLSESDLGRALAIASTLLQPGGVLAFDVQRPNVAKWMLDRCEPGKVHNFRFTRRSIERVVSNVSALHFQSALPFEQMLVLIPAAVMSGSLLDSARGERLVRLGVALDRYAAPIVAGANRWFVTCVRG